MGVCNCFIPYRQILKDTGDEHFGLSHVFRIFRPKLFQVFCFFGTGCGINCQGGDGSQTYTQQGWMLQESSPVQAEERGVQRMADVAISPYFNQSGGFFNVQSPGVLDFCIRLPNPAQQGEAVHRQKDRYEQQQPG
jgi:hypothetical protein